MIRFCAKRLGIGGYVSYIPNTRLRPAIRHRTRGLATPAGIGLGLLLACLCPHELTAQPVDRPQSEIAQLIERADQLRNSRPDQALKFAQRAARLARQTGDQPKIARALDVAGVLQRKLGRYDRSVELHLEARSLYTELEDSMGIAFTLANLGNVYRTLGDLEQALDYHNQALAKKEKLGDQAQIAYSLSRTGGIHGELGHYDEALADLERATMIYTRMGHQGSLLPTLSTLAEIYAKSGEQNRALSYYRNSLDLAQKNGDLFGSAVVLAALGPLQIEKGQAELGLASLERALTLGEQLGSARLRQIANLRLYEYYLNEHQIDAALQAHIRYSAAKDDMFNEVSVQKIKGLEAAYELESHQRRIESLQQEQQSARMIGYVLGGSAFLALMVAGTALMAYRGTRRSNQALTERNRELDLTRGQLKHMNRELENLSRTDSLTGLCNRRGMRERLETEVQRAVRSGDEFSVVMADVDNFKKINDKFGHFAGDRVLVAIADVLTQSTRGADLAARWGGDEFLVILADSSVDDAPSFANRVRAQVEALAIDWNGKRVEVTITMGVAKIDAAMSLDRSLAVVDEMLYLGKQGGRNRVTVA